MGPTPLHHTSITFIIAAFAWILPGPASAQTPCKVLTQPAIQAVITTIATSRSQAQADAIVYGVGGRYAVAATYNLAYLQDAENQLNNFDAWLLSQGFYTPFVNNASAAYNLHGTIREISNLVHYARHWATISAVHHGSASAGTSVKNTSEALTLLDPLGASAATCYISFAGL
jgi:hypothetical protein